MSIRHWVYNLIRDDDENDLKSNIFDGFIITLIIINIALVITDTFNMPAWYDDVSGVIEIFSVAVFSIEYLARLWVAPMSKPSMRPALAAFKYAISFMAVVDLLAILPFYIPFLIPVDLRVLRALRIVRLLRLFKVNRYTGALTAIANVLKRKASQLVSSFFVIFLLMIIASVLMYNIESPAQPDKFENAFSALWWAVATFTTVGYGDVYPITALGKLLSGIISILGIGLVAVPTGIISAGFIEETDSNNNADDDKRQYCPYCGHKIDK